MKFIVLSESQLFFVKCEYKLTEKSFVPLYLCTQIFEYIETELYLIRMADRWRSGRRSRDPD